MNRISPIFKKLSSFGTLQNDERFHISNDLVNKEDLTDHYAVGAVFISCDKILILYHNKYKFWTLPIGKVKYNTTSELALMDEMKEELNVELVCIDYIGSFRKLYFRGNNKYVTINSQLYLVQSWYGEIQNKEPDKHQDLKWVSMDELKEYKPDQISDFLRFFINVWGY